MNIETSNVTVSLELLDVSKMKVDCRPPLSKRRNSRTGCVVENGENAPYSQMSNSNEDERSKQNDTLKPLDSLENIENKNMDRKSTAEEPKLSKEESQELRNLKELLLLHLDLIQQQQELLVMKDKQIVQYKEENTNLKCRLERMERRMSLLKGDSVRKIGSVLSPGKAQNTRVLNDNYVHKDDHSNRGLKRRTSLEPQSLAKRFASIARKEYEKDKAQGRIRGRHSDRSYFVSKRHRNNVLNRLSLQCRKKALHLGRQRSETVTNSSSAADKTSSHSNKRQSENDSQISFRSLRNRSMLSSSFSEGLCIKSGNTISSTPQRLQVDSDISFKDISATPTKRTDSKNNKGKVTNGHSRRTPKNKQSKKLHMPKDCSILKTDILYYSPVAYDDIDVISPKRPAKSDEVAVPTYRIKKFVPYYTIEGTENFDDEVYAKRHQKYEAEEKKRKRWDLQRQRELEQLEKLQRNNRQNGRDETDNDDNDTFVPDPDKVKYVEVCDEIPVSVFGAAIPKLEDEQFDLPWFNIEKRDRQEARRSKGKKR